eukprot:Rmarinus@m.13321
MDPCTLSDTSPAKDIENALYAIVKDSTGDGVSEQQASAIMTGVSQEKIVNAMNTLLRKHRLRLLRAANGAIVMKSVSHAAAERMSGLTREDILLFQLIEQSSDKGIWVRDLRMKSNLQNARVTKSLKVLEDKKLIKSVNLKNKRLYMLFDMQPHPDIAGTPYHVNGEVDSVFVETMLKACRRFIANKKCSTAKTVFEAIRSSGISTIPLREADIQRIIDILVYDGVIEQAYDDVLDESVYRARPPLSIHNRMTEIPCGVCPVFEQCVPGGVISPENCIYMTEWLSF